MSTAVQGREINEEKMNAFLGKVVGDFGASLSSALVYIGQKLGLYKALSDAGPATPAELAQRTNTNERYVREWLINQAAGGYAEYDPESGRYSLTPEQATLYEAVVREEMESVENADSAMARRGSILRMLTRLKQICNHPSQWLNDNQWAEEDSGKWARLREIAEVIAARQEKMLVFTQFREMTAPLATFLGGIFGRSGLVP